VKKMGDYVARERLYHTLDRKEVVKEGDPRAAFLIAAEGDVVPESEVKRLKLDGHFEKAEEAPATERVEARLENALDRGALYEAQSLQNSLDRSEMAKKAGVPDRVALEAGSVGAVTAGIPTPMPERQSRVGGARGGRSVEAPARASEADQAPVHKADAPAPASSGSSAKR
jgi:hypothetical protein